MARRFDPRVVGAFVLSAIALGVVAAVYLGAGRLLQRRVRFVAVFSEDLAGLETDAPVKFRGVPVGRVSSIHLSMESATEPLRELRMPVVIELNQTRIQEMGGRIDLADPEAMRTLIRHGLRARLALESFLSNRRYVDLDILPTAPPATPSPIPLPYPEIPVYAEPGWAALQADVSKLLTKLHALDLEGLVADLRRAASSIDRAAARVDAAAAAVPPALGTAQAAVASVGEALGDAARAFESNLPPLATDARAAAVQLRATLERADGALRDVGALVDPASPVAWQLGATLAELQGAARALRHLAEDLDRDPSALVRGRAEVRR
ncbi:MlaD family protein [Anaeromyxobacter dehalogenans]|uniref:Mammalian cell entry related protein n=1 Tax=Anaeromyxobacter dehalogenans (strain 2CP-C) TaxID=290397 RepID=Q2IEA1_ANADE|nr:MlaD family protein [Anaeromyxobacter dehalogenans]ABC82907.1 Mammalian cell entry related protein [Anaeromyxobacter dehalogenans 2CP-C]